ncbi:MAG: multiple sugar transport system substrate-binding protein [Granulosicoccus sp.]
MTFVVTKRSDFDTGTKNRQSYSEGPYETHPDLRSTALFSAEISRVVDFIEQLDQEMAQALSRKPGYSETRLFTTIMRNHLTGKLTTSSSLAANSGLSYGSGMRAITSLMERDLIVKRARTSTGKSFSLHPTEKMLNEWQELARRVRSLLGSSFPANGAGDRGSDYFFGESYAAGNVLPPPVIMENKLSIRQGLRILVHADPTFMAMHGLKKQFETIFGVPIKNRALSIDRLRREIIENSQLAESGYDLIACDLPWFGEMGQADRFLPLNDLINRSELDLSDFHSEALASARYKGQQLGIPVQTTPELLVYRKDIFAEHGLTAPQTIDETLFAAKKIHDPFTGGMAGIAWNAGRGTPLGHSFLFVMAAFGTPAINLKATQTGFDGENVTGENFRPMFNTDAARNTAEYFMELLNYSPRGILNMSWYERARSYAKGEAAIAYCATLLAPLFELDRQSPAYGNTEYLPHPRGLGGQNIAPIGGYALAIPANVAPHRIDPIWTALTSLTSAQAVKLYIENGSLVSPRFSVSVDPEVRRVSPLISIVDDMARCNVVRMWPRPPIPEIADIIAIAGEEFHDMLLGSKSVEQALSNAQNRADKLMREHGHY